MSCLGLNKMMSTDVEVDNFKLILDNTKYFSLTKCPIH